MKKIVSLIAAGTLLLSACKKDADVPPPSDSLYSENEAVITGYDFSECACCGGYIISIVNNPPYGKDFLTLELPDNMQMQPNSVYPIYVKMKWAIDTGACNERYIHIISMEKK